MPQVGRTRTGGDHQNPAELSPVDGPLQAPFPVLNRGDLVDEDATYRRARTERAGQSGDLAGQVLVVPAVIPVQEKGAARSVLEDALPELSFQPGGLPILASAPDQEAS